MNEHDYQTETEEILTQPEPTDTLEIPLSDENKHHILSLSRWAGIVGIITIIWGVLNLLSMVGAAGNAFFLIPMVILTVFYIYIGTRLTSSAAHLKQGMNELSPNDFVFGLHQLKIFFAICVGFFILSIIFIITIVVLVMAFGFAIDNFPV